CISQKYCPECADPETRTVCVDWFEMKTLGEIDLTKDLLIEIPSCGHIFTMSSLDGIMAIDEFYASIKDSETGERICWSGLLSPSILQKQPTCPTCRKLIVGITRYGRVINRVRIDSQNRTFIADLDRRLQEARTKVAEECNKLDQTRCVALRP